MRREGRKLDGDEVDNILVERLCQRIQDYIDNNDIYKVTFGHYEGIQWVPLQTERINIKEAIDD